MNKATEQHPCHQYCYICLFSAEEEGEEQGRRSRRGLLLVLDNVYPDERLAKVSLINYRRPVTWHCQFLKRSHFLLHCASVFSMMKVIRHAIVHCPSVPRAIASHSRVVVCCGGKMAGKSGDAASQRRGVNDSGGINTWVCVCSSRPCVMRGNYAPSIGGRNNCCLLVSSCSF